MESPFHPDTEIAGCLFVHLKNGDDFPFINLPFSGRASDKGQGKSGTLSENTKSHIESA